MFWLPPLYPRRVILPHRNRIVFEPNRDRLFVRIIHIILTLFLFILQSERGSSLCARCTLCESPHAITVWQYMYWNDTQTRTLNQEYYVQIKKPDRINNVCLFWICFGTVCTRYLVDILRMNRVKHVILERYPWSPTRRIWIHPQWECTRILREVQDNVAPLGNQLTSTSPPDIHNTLQAKVKITYLSRQRHWFKLWHHKYPLSRSR